MENLKIYRWKDAFAGLKIKCPVDVNLLYALQEIFWQEGKEKTLRWVHTKSKAAILFKWKSPTFSSKMPSLNFLFSYLVL